MNQKSRKARLRRFFLLKTVAAKSILACLISFTVIFGSMLVIFDDALFLFETLLLESRLSSEMGFLKESLTKTGLRNYHIVDGCLYVNDQCIGDGSVKNAYLKPFSLFQIKTGTVGYAFVKTDDENLHWVGDSKNGYMQGHYRRVAGTTRGPNGESIIGTYIDREVADILDRDGLYVGRSNVSGNPIYSRYEVLRNSKGEIVGCISLGQSMAELYAQTDNIKSQILGTMITVTLLSIAGYILISCRWTMSISRINEYLSRIIKGPLPEDRLQLKTQDELSEVADSVNDLTDSLREKQRMGAELNVAANIQVSLLPNAYPAFPEHDEFDIATFMHPAREVGGDFYDYFMIDDHRVGFIIGDVSGKGVPAALFMVQARTLIRDHALLNMRPKDVFTTVNSMLCEGNPEGFFVTAWMGYLDFQKNVLTYVNAGHNPPLIKRRDGDYDYLRSKPSLVLSAMESLRYKQYEIPFSPGDRLLLYTDGVTESTDAGNKLYGEERLRKCINDIGTEEPPEVLRRIKQSIDSFVGNAEQFDDITMLIFDYRKNAEFTETEFEAVRENLGVVTDFVTGELEKLGASMKTVMQVSVALEEIFVNIASYAYGSRTGTVRIGVTRNGDNALITFKDNGIPFNPLEKPDPDITLSADERGIGGLGIYMVKKTMNKVSYQYKDNQNILVLEKKLV